MGKWQDVIAKEYRKVRVGEVLLITEGEYSDYGVNLIVRALKPFDWAVVADSWEASGKPYGDDEDDQESRRIEWGSKVIKFVPFLIREGYVEDVIYREFHIGDYGRFEPELSEAEPEPNP